MTVKKKVTLIVLAIVLAFVLIIGAALVIILSQPKNLAILSVRGAISDVFRRDEIKPVSRMLKGGSLYVENNGMESDDTSYDEFSYSGKLYFSGKAIMAEDVNVKIDDLKLRGDAYVSRDLIYLSEDEILDDAYGVYLPDFAEELEDSIFAYGSGSDYAITDKEAYEMLLDILENYDAEALEKDTKQVLDEVGKQFWKIVCDNAEFEVENSSVKLDGEKVKAREITLTIDGDATANIVSEMYDFLCDDDTINDYLIEHGEMIKPILVEYGLDTTKDAVDIYEDFLDELDDEIEDICDGIEDDFNEIEIEIVTKRYSAKLLKLTVKDGSDIAFSIKFDKKGARRSESITIKSYDDEIFSYEITENTKKLYKAKLSISGETLMITVNKAKGSYTAKMEDTFSIQGEYQASFGETTLTIDKITLDDTTYKADITLIIDEKDKMPSAPDTYTSISDITDSDVEKWIERFEEFAK